MLARHTLLACGWIAFGFGALGIVLPVLPTTPFILLAAACFLRSSERVHRWLVSHPVFGHHIADYLAGRGLRTRTKVIALTSLWTSIALAVLAWIPLLAVSIVVVSIAALVSVYILRLPTCDT